MYELGNFILESAIKDSAYFLKENPDFFININVSAKQLERLEFKDFVLDILKKYNFPANHLCLEITERCRDLPVKLLRKEIMYMQVEGIHFAMDDYGTGSSSASTVIQVPFNAVSYTHLPPFDICCRSSYRNGKKGKRGISTFGSNCIFCNECINKCNVAASVSYTHLDVYKRQGLCPVKREGHKGI